MGDRRWELRKRQVRGSDKDRKPELQNSDSHFYFKIPIFHYFPLHNSKVHPADLLLQITKTKGVGEASG